MNLFDTTQAALQRAMQGVTLRQETLAENLANANTPNYQRRDVVFEDALRNALGSGPGAVDQVTPQTVVDTASPTRADGSNVDVDRESATLARTGLEHEALVTIAATRNSILRTAMGL
jgi:flagellar basal-body rod protein FlgB